MNIYIPNIKLPKDEPGAFQVIVMYFGADKKLRAECEETHEVTIVPPHGRLGDLDALMKKALIRSERRGRLVNVTDMVISAYDIETAPTIVEAEAAE